MNLHPVRLGAVALALLFSPCAALAQTESIFTGIDADTALTFAHASVPGATGINLRFTGAFSPPPATENHLVVIDFEWGSSPAGPLDREPGPSEDGTRRGAGAGAAVLLAVGLGVLGGWRGSRSWRAPD